MRRLLCRLRGRHTWDPDPGDLVWACTTCGDMLDLSDIDDADLTLDEVPDA